MNPLFNPDQIVYSMDASSLIEAYHSYPFDIFPSLWSKLEELIKNDRLKMFELVFDNEVKDEEIKEWCKEKELDSYIRVTTDQVDQNKAQKLMPILVNPDTGESGGDPWVIALAQDLLNGIVVTQEKLSRNKDKPKIPNVCRDLDIECIDILGLMRKEKWIFNSIILERNQENAE